MKVEWDESTQTITGTKNELLIRMTVNSTEATVNGKAVKISVVPRIMNESTFVPLRFIAESVGGDVTWDEKTNHVDIVTDKGYYVFLAAAKNDLERVKYWLDNGGGPNFKNKNDVLSILSFAINPNNVEMLELLLKSGANPNQSLVGFGDFLRPLVSVVFDKDPRIVQLLVDYGADVQHTTREGTALDTAKKLLKEQKNDADKQKLEQITKILEKAMASK
ncbi:stalk domain-containing protein [Paenibacillus alginolyticus]|uniref:Stalk domain-containing protein n=1 Tax=Paenibacillus alginolyticus TaxID=59839 RepID=A0ABT4GLR9_9BACL|nr:stalk domain-containing protein [Paenibacillus alginolyticus]